MTWTKSGLTGVGDWVHESRLVDAEEKADHERLSKNCAIVLKQKRLIIWERMLSEVHYQDLGIVQQCREGFNLSRTSRIHRVV